MGELDEEAAIYFEVVLVATHTNFSFFNANELKEGGQLFVELVVGVHDK